MCRRFVPLAATVSLFMGIGCQGPLDVHTDSVSPDGFSSEDANGDPKSDPPDAQHNSCQPLQASDRTGQGPAPLLEEPVFQKRPQNLGLPMNTERYQHIRKDLDGMTVHVVAFPVTTFEERFGRDWVHPVRLIAPAPEDLSADDLAATSAGFGTMNQIARDDNDPVWGMNKPSWFEGTDADGFERTFSRAALSQGIPMVFTDVVPNEIALEPELVERIQLMAQSNGNPCDDDVCESNETDEKGRYVISNESQKGNCMNRVLFANRDLTSASHINYAVAHSRILDAAEEVMRQLYEKLGSKKVIKWKRIVTIGSSKRGNQARMLAAIDSRVQDVMVAAADIANNPVFFDLEDRLWDGGYSFWYHDADTLFSSDIGKDYLRAMDMYFWRPEVLAGVHFVLAVGTNDHMFPLPASLGYARSMPEDFHMLLAPSYAHGHGTVDHVAAFRALVRSASSGAEWPELDAYWDLDNNEVIAMTSDFLADPPTLWCSTSNGTWNPHVFFLTDACTKVQGNPMDSPDLRHAVWTPTDMTLVEDNVYSATPPENALSWPACFVRALTRDEIPVTSLPLLSRPLCEDAGFDVGP